jgi:ABC-2 type transport system ATP-binding protein
MVEMNSTHPMIEAQKLTKFYGQHRAISNVTFTVNRGEILGFLGPNGAGKTTTMKILTCFISPSSGTARVNGHDVFDASLEARRQTGYLPESAPLYKEMTVLEDLQFFAEMRGVAAAKRAKAIQRVVEVCGLGEVVGHEIRELSKGFRQRVGLAQAMIHDPDILILDEPTSGLDPNQIVEIRGLIKQLGREKTIILSTHNLSEVQATCGRVIIVNRGTIAADGTVEELSRQQEGRRHTVITSPASADVVKRAIESLGEATRTERGRDTADGEAVFEVVAEGDKDLRAVLAKAVVEAGAPLLGLQRQDMSLESVFRGLTLEETKAGKAARAKAKRKEREAAAREAEAREAEEPETGSEEEEGADDSGSTGEEE